MSRYFIEVAYRGSLYSGFQIQENAVTIQYEVEKAFQVLHRRPVQLTGSSRTDSGVHALQNYFHFDDEELLNPQFVYKMNALLPADIVIKNIFLMPDAAHARFDATARFYTYRVHQFKNPFLQKTSFFFPYKLDLELMHEGAGLIKHQTNFFPFSKTNTQVKNFNCVVSKSCWEEEGNNLIYSIEANRFLRGMVRAVTATLLKVGRKKLTIQELKNLLEGSGKAGFAVPAHGLFLEEVRYPENYFPAPGLHFTGF
jgi:tRNA pseudouridine38-40 synthase